MLYGEGAVAPVAMFGQLDWEETVAEAEGIMELAGDSVDRDSRVGITESHWPVAAAHSRARLKWWAGIVSISVRRVDREVVARSL